MLATLTSKELEMLRSISQDDLAPPPSQEDIFGQIDAVKKQFEEDHELIARQFEENKVSFTSFSPPASFDNFPQMRMEANFQEKLADRRRRRARHNMEEKELAELGGDNEDDREDHGEDGRDDDRKEKKDKKDKKDKKHHKKKKEKKEKKHKKDKSDDHHDAADERYEE